MRPGEITFRLSGPDMSTVIELIKEKDGLIGAVDNPIGGGIAVRMLNDIAMRLGRSLLTKSQGTNVLLRGGFQPEEAETKGNQEVSQDRFTFFVNPEDTPFLLDLLNQKAMLEKSCEEQPDPGRKGIVMWEIEKLCCRIGNVLVLKNQGVMIDRAPISDKEQK